ncbi:MAG: ABC transporter permease subunit [Phycisphaerales bacterium]|nr:ABC transporter permease subunit [Phycisphaerales bacterium]
MYRTLVILRHTFHESIIQPIYPLLLAVGAAILLIYSTGLGAGPIPFFTFGEDTLMYKAVALDTILILVLVMTLFATSKSIYEEIEDRTMLTLMSKPVQRWEVLVGKYLGIISAALLAIVVLGFLLILGTWARIPDDYTIRASSFDANEIARLHDLRMMHIAGLLPALFLLWLQVSVLAAVGVAISTRLSLVVNLPIVIILYIAGNLTRFLISASQGVSLASWKYWLSIFLPYLEVFDLRQKTVYSKIALTGTSFANDINAVTVSQLWFYVAAALLYAVAYSAFALSAGMWSFQTRELGGAEG